jgi:hypothetical protein
MHGELLNNLSLARRLELRARETISDLFSPINHVLFAIADFRFPNTKHSAFGKSQIANWEFVHS